MTNKNKQIEQKQEVLGWLIALQTVIDGFLESLFPQFMSLSVVIWFSIILFILLCFWDRNLLKKQDNWKKNKIAWGWCLFSPVYLYKRARLLKESLLKFWVCIISGVLSMIYGMITVNQFTPAIQNTIYKDCAYEMGYYGVDKEKAKDICWSKQVIFNNCVDNLMDKGTYPNMVIATCKEHISKINLCAKTIVKEAESEISMETALEFCICTAQYGKQYCLEKYGTAE